MSSDPVGRVNYFDGEVLLTKDFQDEQAYHVQMREWLNQGVYKPGVVCGLDVQWRVGGTDVTVTSGRALDRNGRLIVQKDDTVYTPTLQDGKQNYLTIGFNAELGDSVSEPYGDGCKRLIEKPLIDCKPDFDPQGDEILLAVIGVQNGAIQAVYYYFGQYERRHVGAVLGEVRFLPEGSASLDPDLDGMSSSQTMAISAQRDVDTGAPYLAIDAPEIRVQGPVMAGGAFTGSFDGEISGRADLTGTFNGTFTGNGAGLTGVRATGYWQQGQGQDPSLFYTAGNVGINDRAPDAVLSVGQPVHSRIGEGLVTVTAMDQGVATLQGYQTNFTSELIGKILQFGVVLKQQAVIASVDSEERLTLVESFPLGLGPTQYSYVQASQGADTETVGLGFITPDGKSVTASANVQFETQAKLKAGDVLVIDRFVPDQQVIESKKATAATDTDTNMTLTVAFSEDVTDSAYMFSTEPGRWATGAGTITSSGKDVTGAGTHFTQLPANATIRALRALDVASAPQTWRVEKVTDTTHLKMRKISVDEGSPLLPMMSSFAQTSWPLMKVGGGTQPSIPPALTVVQNNGGVPNTVAINVDDQAVKLDSTYALQVNGPTKFEGGSLEIDGPLDVDGDLHVTGRATIDKDLSAGGDFDVAGKGTIGGLLTALKDLRVDGGVTVAGTSNFEGAMTTVDVSSTGTATFSHAAEIESGATFTLESGAKLEAETGATFDVQCPATFDAVTAGSMHITGDTVLNTVTACSANVTGNAVLNTVTVDGDAEIDGKLTVKGTAEIKNKLTLDSGLLVQSGDTTVQDLWVLGTIKSGLPSPAAMPGLKFSFKAIGTPYTVPRGNGNTYTHNLYAGVMDSCGLIVIFPVGDLPTAPKDNYWSMFFTITITPPHESAYIFKVYAASHWGGHKFWV